MQASLRSMFNDGSGDDGPSPEQHARKRPKMAFSCSECKRRKIKCDRNEPCIACIKRGAGDSCNWDDAKIEPSPQPFALNSDMREVKERLRAIEEILQSLPEELRSGVLNWRNRGFPEKQGFKTEIADGAKPSTPSTTLTGTTPSHRSRDLLATPSQPAPTSSDEPVHMQPRGLDEDYNDAAEDAAVVLERVAFNPPSNKTGNGPESIISHEYWRGSMLTSKANERNRLDPKMLEEYTTAFTIIKAPPWNPDLERYNPAIMCDAPDDSGTPSELLQRRVDAINSLLANLPTMRQSYYLASLYRDTVEWRYHVLHFPSFQAELDRFWEMVSQNRHTDVDPLWLAVFFMVMALALDNRPATLGDSSNPFHGYSHQDLGNLIDKYHAVSVRALYLGDAMAMPRVRTIQTIILFNQYFQTSTTWRKADMMLNWIALAVRTAQILGLHTLGSNPEIMPPDDPAWPPGKNAVKRHLALRTWMLLQWADWMSASARFRCYIIHPEQCTSQTVDNVNDWELSATDWRYTPHPRGVITSTSFEVYKWNIANMLRRTYDKFITQAATFRYSTVLDLDAGYRKVLEDLPPQFRSPNDSMANEDPRIRWQRNVALEGIHCRIVRLHRPFLSRSYSRGSKFAYSRDQCLHSARTIVECHYNLRDLTTTGTFWFVYSHTLGAAIVLFLDLFWSIDNELPPMELVEKMRIVSMLQEIFSNSSQISNPSLRTIVNSSSRIINDLTAEAKVRQTTQSFNSNGQLVPAKRESFAEVLRRISRNLSISNGSTSEIWDGTVASLLNPTNMPVANANVVGGSVNQSGGTWADPNQMAQDRLNSGFYSALGVENHDAISHPAFASLWTLNTSPSSHGESPGDSQLDLSAIFGNQIAGSQDDRSAPTVDDQEIWRFLVG